VAARRGAGVRRRNCVDRKYHDRRRSVFSVEGTILVAGVAGLVAGAMSMAVGEYVSVSSQRDAQQRTSGVKI